MSKLAGQAEGATFATECAGDPTMTGWRTPQHTSPLCWDRSQCTVRGVESIAAAMEKKMPKEILLEQLRRQITT
jgi:hypothetical protein